MKLSLNPGTRWIVFNLEGVYDLEGNLLGIPRVKKQARKLHFFSVRIEGKLYLGQGQVGMVEIRPKGYGRAVRVPPVEWGNCPEKEKKRLQRALRRFYRAYIGEPNKPKAYIRQFMGDWYLEVWHNNKLVTRL